MANIFLRHRTWWIKFHHPATGARIRESLETRDPARAELLRRRIELEVALGDPRLGAAEIPPSLRDQIHSWSHGTPARPLDAPAIPAEVYIPPAPAPALPSSAKSQERVRIEEALTSYLASIRGENAPRHVENKLSMLRRFLGTARVERFVQSEDPKSRARRLECPTPGFFAGEFLDEITPSLLQEFFLKLDVSTKTKRHYREFLHHFFKYCINFELYRPSNFHCPNPLSALPSYLEKNRIIVYLTPEDVEAQLAILEPHPELHIAAAVMIYAGLRRSEALWLTQDAISSDLAFISVVNRIDEETDIESTLKTGERSVTILPPLQRLLEKYLPTLHGQWLVPKPKGGRWTPDGFSRKLRKINDDADLKWSCMHFRHTYATQRAAQGWSLFRIAQEMGNSVAVVEEYYAAYIRPPEIGAPEAHGKFRLVQGGAA